MSTWSYKARINYVCTCTHTYVCVCVYAYTHACVVSSVRLFTDPRTVACQAPLWMGFPRQEYWSRLPFPTPGYFPNPRVKLLSLASPTLAVRFYAINTLWEALELGSVWYWQSDIQINQWKCEESIYTRKLEIWHRWHKNQ